MNKIDRIAAQGEITIRRITKLPKGLKPVAADNGKFIIGHSKTGHHHVLAECGARIMELETPPPGMRILYAILDEPNELVHEREFDTHEPIGHTPGMYEYRIGREFDPYEEIARRQAD